MTATAEKPRELTPEEQQVLDLAKTGMGRRTIAAETGMGEKEVRKLLEGWRADGTLSASGSTETSPAPVAPSVELLPVADIRMDGVTQSRASMDQQAIADYAEAMREGAPFPPVTVFYDGAAYWLADGFHRVHATIQAQIEEINATVHQGHLRDAIRWSLSANAQHGLRRTNADKRRAVERALDDAEWSQLPSREIGDLCGVSHTFVNNVRDERAGGTKAKAKAMAKAADAETGHEIGHVDIKGVSLTKDGPAIEGTAKIGQTTTAEGTWADIQDDEGEPGPTAKEKRQGDQLFKRKTDEHQPAASHTPADLKALRVFALDRLSEGASALDRLTVADKTDEAILEAAESLAVACEALAAKARDFVTAGLAHGLIREGVKDLA